MGHAPKALEALEASPRHSKAGTPSHAGRGHSQRHRLEGPGLVSPLQKALQPSSRGPSTHPPSPGPGPDNRLPLHLPLAQNTPCVLAQKKKRLVLIF